MERPENHIFEQTPDSLAEWCAAHGLQKYRAAQILDWVYKKGVCEPADMTNLSARNRDLAAAGLTFLSGPTVAQQTASDGTQKLLIQWTDAGADTLPIVNADGLPAPDPARQTECVMIPTESRRTACVSSQIGCPVGCRFCASGMGGLDGNLSAGRIVEQVWRLAQLPGVGRISNVVFMGMGEPLANFGAVKKAIEIMTAEWGLGISARKITVSTVGLPQAIERLARELDLPVTLALSLHAPTDEIRRALIPWSEYTSIDELISACDKWFQKTGREITLEYTLLRDVNDRIEHAEGLAKIAKRIRANVNLIRFNEVGGVEYRRPRDDAVHAFQKTLTERGVNVHIRASRGRDIAAACGQLRHETAGSVD